MKPLGPYVAARDLPGRMNSPVRTLRATDRLTGMPVLLHGLPAPLALPELPLHPNVLVPAECLDVAGEAFMVTELPLQARPAQDPDLTARGALAALAALHGRGVVHGGLSASQLWSVDGEVCLAGAGLPWGGDARPADDLYALAVILHEMGGVPAPLRPLLDAPGSLDAQGALRLLRAPTPARPAPQAPATPAIHTPAPHTPDAPVPDVAGEADAAPQPEATVPDPVPEPAPEASAPDAPVPVTPMTVAPVPVAPVAVIPAVQAGAPDVPGEPARPTRESAVSPDRPATADHTVRPGTDTGGSRGRRGRGSRFRLPGLGAAREAALPDTPPTSAGPAPAEPAPGGRTSGGLAPTVRADDAPATLLPGASGEGPDAASPAPAAAATPEADPVEVDPIEAAPATVVDAAAEAAPVGSGPPDPAGPTGRSLPAGGAAHDGTPIVLGDPLDEPAAVEASAPAPAVTAAPDAGIPAGTGGKLSPQERRRREHEARREQAELDALAAARRRQQRLEAAPPAPVPAPIQIGFDDLPEWEAGEDAPRPQVQIREVPRLPASLRRAPLPEEPAPEDVGAGARVAGAPLEDAPVGALPARRRTGEPIRIGWDEDDSWRVVREAQAPARTRRPLLWRALFWAVLVAAFVGMALLLVKAVQARGQGQAAPSVSRASGSGAAAPAGAEVTASPAAPEPVQFTVRGAAGATARLWVEQAPKAANLTPGASLGTAPGRVAFPAPGTYRVRVVVAGYAPGSLTVTVPRAQPVTIDLDR